jgi:hypothetical protein
MSWAEFWDPVGRSSTLGCKMASEEKQSGNAEKKKTVWEYGGTEKNVT